MHWEKKTRHAYAAGYYSWRDRLTAGDKGDLRASLCSLDRLGCGATVSTLSEERSRWHALKCERVTQQDSDLALAPMQLVSDSICTGRTPEM